MAINLTAAQKRFIGVEMAISTVACGLLPSCVIWFAFSPFPLPLWGGGGFLIFVVKNSFGMVTVMTTIMSLVNRRKISRGIAPRLDMNGRPIRWLRLVPPWLVLRAPLYGALTAVVAAPLSLLVMTLLGVATLNRPGFIAFNVIYGMLVGLTLTPLILISVMSERQAAGATEQTA